MPPLLSKSLPCWSSVLNFLTWHLKKIVCKALLQRSPTTMLVQFNCHCLDKTAHICNFCVFLQDGTSNQQPMAGRLQARCCNAVVQVQFNDTIRVLCRQRFRDFQVTHTIQGVGEAKVQINQLRGIRGKNVRWTKSDVKTRAGRGCIGRSRQVN